MQVLTGILEESEDQIQPLLDMVLEGLLPPVKDENPAQYRFIIMLSIHAIIIILAGIPDCHWLLAAPVNSLTLFVQPAEHASSCPQNCRL